jgi:hypothetical protein
VSDHKERYDRGELATTSGREPKHFDSPAPDPEIIETGSARGQHKDYWVLSEAERAKGFVRPVRSAYVHVGAPEPEYPLRDLTDDEHARYDKFGYIKYEEYPKPKPDGSSAVGSFWTQARLDRIGTGCRAVTTMGRDLAETYARNPSFYGSTFCVHCGTHLPVGKQGEFLWDGTNERVGT